LQYSLKRTVDPTVEPVSVTELKAHLRIDWTEEDEALLIYLKAAREYAEAYTSRSFSTSTYVMRFIQFPSDGDPIRLPRLPLIEVESLTYTDNDGNSTMLFQSPPTNTAPQVGSLDVVESDDSAEIYPGPENNHTWPTVTSNGRVRLTFVAGYTTVPAAVKQAILHHAAHLYRNREAVSEQPLKEAPLAVHSLLDTVRNYSTTF
jgi:uncharacterized phiE125 gp8 family phage protein